MGKIQTNQIGFFISRAKSLHHCLWAAFYKLNNTKPAKCAQSSQLDVDYA